MLIARVFFGRWLLQRGYLHVAIPHVAHGKLHEMCMFHAMSPRKYVMGIFVDFSWHHAWTRK